MSTIITSLLFYAAIELAAKNNHFNLRALHEVEDLVKQKKRRFIWLAGFINGIHEIALKIDFEQKEISYGVFKLVIMHNFI